MCLLRLQRRVKMYPSAFRLSTDWRCKLESHNNNNIRALTESKPPPTPKFQAKMLRDSNPNFRINPDTDVCRICRKMLWMHYLVGFSHFAKYGTKRTLIVWEMLTNVNSKKIPYYSTVKKIKKWSEIHTQIRITTKNETLLEGHPLPMRAKSGRRPFPRSSVILFTEWQTEWQTERSHDPALLTEVIIKPHRTRMPRIQTSVVISWLAPFASK